MTIGIVFQPNKVCACSETSCYYSVKGKCADNRKSCEFRVVINGGEMFDR